TGGRRGRTGRVGIRKGRRRHWPAGEENAGRSAPAVIDKEGAMTTKEIRLRYFDVNGGDALRWEALAPEESHQAKLKALDKLGIARVGEEKPGDAWLRVMCEENGLPYTQPVPREIAEAIVWDQAVYRFYFWLA